MGGSLPEVEEGKGYDPTSIQDPYAEDEQTSSTRRLCPLGFRSILWLRWRPYLIYPQTSNQLCVRPGITDSDFWRTTGGNPLTYMEEVCYLDKYQ